MEEAVTPASLVLLDELGRATDPEEGGALGVAILEEFRHTSAFTLASTHLLALKIYGSNSPGVLNAAMGFDEQTLAPTYQLRTGSPGKSAGLEIATRLGLPPHLIDRARAAMSSTQRDIERFLHQLEARLGEAEQAKAEQAAKLAALEARERQLETEAERKQAAKLREIEKQVAEAGARFEQQAKATIESVLASAEQRKAAERSLRQVARTKREFAASVERLKTGAPAVPAVGEIVPGVRVRLRDVGQPARVLRLLPDGALEVEVGLLKLQTAREDVVEVLPAAPAAKTLPKGVSFSPGPRWDTLAREVNVIGQNTEDALDAVDKALDSAVLTEVTHLRIVHGHGHGILRRAIDKHLSRHPQVEKHYPASPQEGGTGATVVELKA
jgi:DNA mismatch repair protein MutS2